MGGEILDEVEDIEILPNFWADHNPLKINWRGRKKTRCRWTLNTQILKHTKYFQKLREELTYFFKENNKQNMSTQNLWDIMKAVTWGIIISYSAKRNKEKFAQQNKLQETIKKLETKLQNTPQNIKLKEQLTLSKHKLNLADQEEMVKNLKIARQTFFEQANKP
uniref:Uncharacterized protein n=1 Tax=Micrurus spixii TaxID=129469 RepID=A0A2D4LLC6_9SAUR